MKNIEITKFGRQVKILVDVQPPEWMRYIPSPIVLKTRSSYEYRRTRLFEEMRDRILEKRVSEKSIQRLCGRLLPRSKKD